MSGRTILAGHALIGQRIRERRTAQGVSQAALAARTGLVRGQITVIESGKRYVSAAELADIAEFLAMPDERPEDVAWELVRGKDGR